MHSECRVYAAVHCMRFSVLCVIIYSIIRESASIDFWLAQWRHCWKKWTDTTRLALSTRTSIHLPEQKSNNCMHDRCVWNDNNNNIFLLILLPRIIITSYRAAPALVVVIISDFLRSNRVTTTNWNNCTIQTQAHDRENESDVTFDATVAAEVVATSDYRARRTTAYYLL